MATPQQNSTKLVPVYAPDGHEERHTPPNARDLVNAGWSWAKLVPSTPMDTAPFAVPPTKKFTKSAPQEVLDRLRGEDDPVEDAAEPVDDGDAGSDTPVGSPAQAPAVAPEPATPHAATPEPVTPPAATPVVETPAPVAAAPESRSRHRRARHAPRAEKVS